MNTVFLRVLEADDKAAALRAAIHEPEAVRSTRRFDVDAGSFAAVPRSPFAYWVSKRLRGLFAELPPFESGGRLVLGGLKTLSDERFLRTWWERPVTNWTFWPPLAKGGAFSSFYADVFLCVNWKSEGEEISWYGYQRRPREGFGAASRGMDAYFRPGLTWPRRTQAFGVRVLPAGCIFADKGPAAFMKGDEGTALLAQLSVLCSKVVNALIGMNLNAADATARSYEVGVIQRTPTPLLTPDDQAGLAKLARNAWLLKRSLDTCTETSHAFTLPALLQVTSETLAERADAWVRHVRVVDSALVDIQTDIDLACFDLYSIDSADRRVITEGLNVATASTESAQSFVETDSETDNDNEMQKVVDSVGLVSEFIAWAVGVAFGRFDVRLATGERALPADPDPFDPLPVCSPAMLTGGDGMPLTIAPIGYPLTFPENGILLDDPGQRLDLTAAVRRVFDEVFGTSADALWNEAANLLDPRDHDLHTWLASNFFEHHLKRYSKSRRKAPILWQLGTASTRYSVWLYAHRLTRDTFFQIQNDVVGSKLAHEERQLTSLVQTAGGSPSAKDRKEIAAQETFVGELRAMLDEVKRVTPLWAPNLDDGVVLTMAPLWRLVPQHRSWQKELKSKWDELVAGKYAWAHIAMHLWPERVVPKCATDRSLAIAHGLEDVFWIKGKDGKWGRRSEPTCPVEELVNERTSQAVKAALKSLLEAPQNGGTRGRGRRKATGLGAGGDE